MRLVRGLRAVFRKAVGRGGVGRREELDHRGEVQGGLGRGWSVTSS